MENKQQIESIKQILEKVAIISKKYDDIAEATGENFNVFKLLGVNHYENTHSSIIAFFLNSKENHGQKDLYLKLFFEVLNEKFLNNAVLNENTDSENETNFNRINKFQTEGSCTHTEYYVGKIDDEYSTGGKLDILIKDLQEINIIIENKIFAADQEGQLKRYNAFDKKAPIFYLNLFGNQPDEYAKRDLMEDNHFFIISYEKEIVKWLEKCIKESVNKPFIRESLTQYLHLIKDLTNQSNNKIMEKEIANLLVQNFSSFASVLENQQAVFNLIQERLLIEMTRLADSLKITLNQDFNFNKDQYSSFYFTSDTLKELKLSIIFGFEEKLFSQFNFGFEFTSDLDKNMHLSAEIKSKFENEFKVVHESNSSPAWTYFENNELSNLEFLKIVVQDDFKPFVNSIKDKIVKMLQIVDSLKENYQIKPS